MSGMIVLVKTPTSARRRVIGIVKRRAGAAIACG